MSGLNHRHSIVFFCSICACRILSIAADRRDWRNLKNHPKRQWVDGVDFFSTETSISIGHRTALRALGEGEDESANENACRRENEQIWFGDNGKNPRWFQSSFKDFSSFIHIEVDDDEKENHDFTNLMHHLKAPCEMLGGVLHSISGTQICKGESYSYNGIESDYDIYVDTNIPICVGPSCEVDLMVLDTHPKFSHCPAHDYHSLYHVERVDSGLSEACKAELSLFDEKVAYGQPDLAFSIGSNIHIEDHCTVDDEDITFCNFGPIVDDFISTCEMQGGRLYKFSDKFKAERSVSKPHTYLNQPVCIGASCDVERYFEEYIIGYFKFALEGTFYSDDGIAYNQDYHFIGYEAVASEASSAGKMSSFIISVIAVVIPACVSIFF